ncbi:hypothetical protein ES706_03794 [subsurface metagenome]
MKYLPFVEKIIMNDEKKEKDDSLSDALSALGWIEEEEGKESKEEMPSSLEDQVNFLLKKNKQLEEQNLMLKNYIEQLDSSSSKAEKPEVPNDFESKINEKDGIISKLTAERDNINKKLKEQREKIISLGLKVGGQNDLLIEKDKQINEFSVKFSQLNEKENLIKQLEAKIKEFELGEHGISEFQEKIKQRDSQIQELHQQIQYLEKDTIQKSKYDKLKVIIEKKDEIITQKEKALFDKENSLSKAKEEINELTGKVKETEKIHEKIGEKNEEINFLKGEINHLNQQLEKSKSLQDKIKEFEEQLIKRERENVEITKSSMASEEIVKRVEQKLELAQKESVKKDIEIENLKINFEKELEALKAKENSYLDNIQILKMENSRMEKESGKLKDEIIDLKKKIKVLRRGSS